MKKVRKNRLLGAALATASVLLSGLSVSAATGIPFEADFEAPDFAPGILVSDPDWFFDSAALTVEVIDTDSVSPDTSSPGSQSLTLKGTDDFTLTADDALSTQVRWVDFYVKPVFVAEADLSFSVGSLQSAVTAFVNDGGQGQVYVVDGDGTGSGEWVSAELPIVLSGNISQDWVHLAYRIDYANKRWDLYIDDQAVLLDLGFLDNDFTGLNKFALSADASTATGFDHFYVGDISQVDVDGDGIAELDSDNDGIADVYEAANGLNALLDDRSGDIDHDSISNIEEYFGGLLAGTADTDGDGVHDGQEIRFGEDPAVAGTYSLSSIPFSADFESEALGSIDGVNLWSVESGSATVQTTEVASGTQAVRLAATTEDALLSHNFDGSAHARIWIDFQIKPVFWDSGDGPDVADFLYAPLGVFYFNESGTVTYLNGDGQGGGTWESTAVTLDESQWQRVTLYNDYTTQTWSLWLNGVRVAQDIGFAHPQPYFNHLVFQQGGGFPAYLDELTAASSEPATLDNDGDTLMNDFERTYSAYGFDPDNASDSDLDVDNDGLGTVTEIALGTLFDDAHSDSDGLIDGVEVYLGEDPTVAGTYNGLTADAEGIYTWSTGFEDAEGYLPGALAGQNLWRATAVEATVSEAAAQSGARSLALSAAGAEPVMAHQILTTPQAATTVWISFHAQLIAGQLPEIGEPSTLGALLLTRNPDGNLAVVDGSTLEWVDTGHPLADATWARFDGKLDYASKTFDLYADGIPVVEAYTFINPALPVFSAIQFEQDVIEDGTATARFDHIHVSTAMPESLQTWAKVPDWWKQQIVDADPNDAITTIGDVLPDDSFDDDTRSNLEEYYLGTLPTVADDNVQYYADTSLGDDSAYNGRSAVPGQPSVLHGPKATITDALATAIDNSRILLQSGVYDESALSLNGKNLTLRPRGNVTLR